MPPRYRRIAAEVCCSAKARSSLSTTALLVQLQASVHVRQTFFPVSICTVGQNPLTTEQQPRNFRRRRGLAKGDSDPNCSPFLSVDTVAPRRRLLPCKGGVYTAVGTGARRIVDRASGADFATAREKAFCCTGSVLDSPPSRCNSAMPASAGTYSHAPTPATVVSQATRLASSSQRSIRLCAVRSGHRLLHRFARSSPVHGQGFERPVR